MRLVQTCAFFLGVASIARAFTINRDQGTTTTDEYRHAATFLIPDLGEAVEWHVLGHTGPPSVITLDSATVKSTIATLERRQFVSAAREFERPSNGTLSPRALPDVCSQLAGCTTFAADKVRTAMMALANLTPQRCKAFASGAAGYFSVNDYPKTKDILVQGIFAFSINILSSKAYDIWFNGKVGNDNPLPGKEHQKCDARNPANMAESYASSIYEFCLAIQRANNFTTETRFTDGQFQAGGRHINGSVNLFKGFIAAQKDNFGPVCYSVGVTWKKMAERFNLFHRRPGLLV